MWLGNSRDKVKSTWHSSRAAGIRCSVPLCRSLGNYRFSIYFSRLLSALFFAVKSGQNWVGKSRVDRCRRVLGGLQCLNRKELRAGFVLHIVRWLTQMRLCLWRRYVFVRMSGESSPAEALFCACLTWRPLSLTRDLAYASYKTPWIGDSKTTHEWWEIPRV